MTALARHPLLLACASAATALLSACGGGAEPAPYAAPQTITFTSPGDQTLAVAAPPLVATASSGLAVSFTSTTPSVCTVDGRTLNLLAVGHCAITASQEGNASFAAAPPVAVDFSASLTPQAITFVSPGNQTLGSTPAALTATASSGLAVSFTSATPAICTANGSSLALIANGTCTVEAVQPGNAVYAPASAVSRSFAVATGLVAQSISFTQPADQSFGAAAVPLAAVSSSGLTLTFTSLTPAVCTVTGTSATLAAAGICSIAASQAGDATHAAAASVTQSFTVTPVAQTITFASPGNQTLGSAPAALVATSSTGLAVTLVSTTPGVCTVSGTALTLVSAGTCTLSASQPGNAGYAAATPVVVSFSVAAQPLSAQTIQFSSPGTQTLGSAPGALVATASSGLPVSLSSSTPGVCTTSGTTLTLVAAGTCTVVATQPGNASFAAATPVSHSFAIGTMPVAAQTLVFASPGDQSLGVAPLALTATASSGLPVSFISLTPAVCTVSGSTLTLVAAGTCSISASQAGDSAYSAAASITRSFTVVAPPAAQSITFTPPVLQLLSAGQVTLSATANSGLPVSLATTTPAVCAVSGTTATFAGAGICSVTASQPGKAGYAADAAVTVSFRITIERLANGGFETAGTTTVANAWLSAASGYSLSPDKHSGNFSARLASPAINSAVMLQNSKDQGGLADLTVGESPTLSFWAKGSAGGTGNVLFALRYLDGVGNILANSDKQYFQDSINPTTWTKITYNLGPVPAGAKAAFIEFSQAIGPIDAGNPAGEVLIDDISLKVEP
ncbi:hypothetical protein BH11PSE9_BH11PSE9_16550 [soil metagenome]